MCFVGSLLGDWGKNNWAENKDYMQRYVGIRNKEAICQKELGIWLRRGIRLLHGITYIPVGLIDLSYRDCRGMVGKNLIGLDLLMG